MYHDAMSVIQKHDDHFCPTRYPKNTTPLGSVREFVREKRANHARLEHRHLPEHLSFTESMQLARHGFDFGEFGHVRKERKDGARVHER